MNGVLGELGEGIVKGYSPECKMSKELGNLISPTERLQSISEQPSYSGTFATPVTSSSRFGMPVDSNGTKIEDWFDDPKNIETYCLERLSEIREINNFSQTPSAFSCIFGFMGFLSQFAGADDEESHRYRDLTVKYMRTLRCKVEDVQWHEVKSPTPRKWVSGKGLGDKELFNTWSEILYSLGRCGLLHSLSLAGNRGFRQEQLDLRLTHGVVKDAVTVDLFQKDEKGSEKPVSVISTETEVKRITINANDLCDSVSNGIRQLFQDPDAVARARSIMQDRPAIMAVFESK